MCGRYTPLTEDEIVEVRSIIKDVAMKLSQEEFYASDESYKEVAPTNRVPIVTSSGQELSIVHAQFGFEKWDGNGVIINARAETAHEKPMFKSYVKTGRCVIPASGYYEWKPPDDGKKKKIKHLIKDERGNLLFMAGLWREGKYGREFVIITKEPFGEVVGIHDRMPVILGTDQLESWLSGAMPIEALASIDYSCVGEPLEEATDPGQESSDFVQMTLFDN